jgi:putative transposase
MVLVPIGNDTYAWGRDLLHLQREGKTYFVTYCTSYRRILPPSARTIALEWCVLAHRIAYFLHVATVMPDHVHLVFTLFPTASLSETMKLIKRNSACNIGALTWQRGYFDRILRSDEDLRKKCEYVVNNPVRAGIVRSADEYPWIWRSWIEGKKRG